MEESKFDRHINSLMPPAAESAPKPEPKPEPREAPRMAQPAPIHAPSWDEDPIGAQHAVIQRLAHDNANLRDAAVMASTGAAVERMVAEFKRENPDYDAAYERFVEFEKDQLREGGYSDEEIDGYIDRHLNAMALDAANRGRNPAEAVYKLAQRRGYSRAEWIEKMDDEAFEKFSNQLEEKAKAEGYVPGIRR